MAIVKVQHKAGASVGTNVITLDSAPTAGSLLVAIIANDDDSAVAGISSASGSWTQAITMGDLSPYYLEIYYRENVTASDNVITAAFGAGINVGMTVIEYSGVKTSASLDVTNTNIGDYSVSNPSISLGAGAQADEVYVAGFLSGTIVGTWDAPSNSWIEVAEVDAVNFSFVTDYKIVAASAGQSTSVGQNPALIAGGWESVGASFKAASAAPPSTNKPSKFIPWLLNRFLPW